MRLSQEWNVTHTTCTDVEFSHITGLFLHTLLHASTRLSIVPITGSLDFFQSWLVFRNTVGVSRGYSLGSSVSQRVVKETDKKWTLQGFVCSISWPSVVQSIFLCIPPNRCDRQTEEWILRVFTLSSRIYPLNMKAAPPP